MSCFGLCNKKKKKKNNDEDVNAYEDNVTKTKRRNKLDNSNRNVATTKNETTIYKPLYELKDKFRCLFCGGETCKHEDWTRNKNSVMIGLNCDKINEDLFASQRPLNIGLIVNVQRQGEHPYCGPNKKLEEVSGFTYNPESFTTEGIRVRLSGWKDMNVPDSIPFMLEIVKDMIKTVKQKKTILVHCHAGYGRTGIVLACYMIFTTTKSVEQIVSEIRNVRNECIQKRPQLEYCKTFKLFIDRARLIFTFKKHHIDSFIKHQGDLCYGEDFNLNKFQHVPKLIFVVLEQILEIKINKDLENLKIYSCMNGSSEWLEEFENEIIEFKINLNNGNWEFIKEIEEINILIELCFDWLEDCVFHVINPESVNKIFEMDIVLFDKLKNNSDNLNKAQRKEITHYLKSELRMIEFESLTCISEFICKILPNENEKEEFELMLEKIAIYLLGYNILLLYENQNQKEADDCLIIVEKLIHIINFFVTVLSQDLNNEINNSFYNFKIMNQSQNFQKKSFDELNSPFNSIVINHSKENDLNTYFNSKSNFKFNSLNEKKNINPKYLSVLNLTKFVNNSGELKKNSNIDSLQVKPELFKSDKENFMYDMYKNLHEFFKNQNDKPKNDKFNKINFDQESMNEFLDNIKNYIGDSHMKAFVEKLNLGIKEDCQSQIDNSINVNSDKLDTANFNINLNNNSDNQFTSNFFFNSIKTNLNLLDDQNDTHRIKNNPEEAKDNFEEINFKIRKSNILNNADFKKSCSIISLQERINLGKLDKRPLSHYQNNRENVQYPFIRPKSRKRMTITHINDFKKK